MERVRLERHPSTNVTFIDGVTVGVRRPLPAMLALNFVVDGDIARLRIPPPHSPRIGARLWEHTCFEAFVATAAAPGYYEFNLSPSGEWAAHRFESYRNGATLSDPLLAPGIESRISATHFEFDARIPLDRLEPSHANIPLRLGLAAVLEATDGGLSYWALHHAPGRPDFHHADAFALTLT